MTEHRKYRTARDVAREAVRLALSVEVQLDIDDAQNAVLRVMRAAWVKPVDLGEQAKESAFFGVIASMIANAQAERPTLSDHELRRLYKALLRRSRSDLSADERAKLKGMGINAGTVAIIDPDGGGMDA